MSIEFEEEQQYIPRNATFEPGEPTSLISRLVMKMTGIKSPLKIQFILFGVFLVFVLGTVAFYYFTNVKKSKPTYLEDIPPETRALIPPEVLKNIPSRANKK
jgi:hypothetical protein